MKKIILLFIIVVIFGFNMCSVFAENIAAENGELYVNEKPVETENTVKFMEGQALFPLRTIYEALGAQINWYDEIREMAIHYNGDVYIGYFASINPDRTPVICVRDRQTGKELLLASMTYFGGIYTINNSVYLYEEAGKLLFEQMNCTVNIDKEKHILRINKN